MRGGHNAGTSGLRGESGEYVAEKAPAWCSAGGRSAALRSSSCFQRPVSFHFKCQCKTLMRRKPFKLYFLIFFFQFHFYFFLLFQEVICTVILKPLCDLQQLN